ncbi:repeat protein [Moumouvirus goulette]|uniref:Repeat protein n=1 Tax=Moumouvirus goulette TaxID=1247379 RepID=M1NLW4_9VIRU|nr:repeat protein [Moumouvirus goulette]AGF84990.1 repeat protein [Moumouvirus goulette]
MYYLFINNWRIKEIHNEFIKDGYTNEIFSLNNFVDNKIKLKFNYDWQKIIEERFIYKYWNKNGDYVCEIEPVSKLTPHKINPGIFTTDKFIIKKYYLSNDLSFHKKLIENGVIEDIHELLYWCTVTSYDILDLAKYLINLAIVGDINIDKCINTEKERLNILMLACKNNRNEFAKRLLQYSHFNFNIEKTIESCLFHTNYEMAKYLLEYKKDCSFNNKFNVKIYLPWVCSYSDLEHVKYFFNYSIDRGENIDDILDECLRHAVLSDLDIVKYLVEIGANINNPNLYEDAIINGCIDIVKYLVQCGVDYHIVGDKIIKATMINGHVNIFEYFMDLDLKINNEKNKFLCLAIRKGNFEIINYLYKIGFCYDINCADDFSYLCGLVGIYNLNTIKFIFENTDANFFDKDTIDKCYNQAARNFRISTMEYLFQRGYYPPINYDIFYNLISRGRLFHVEFLLKSEYDISLNDYLAIKTAYKIGNNKITNLLTKNIYTHDINLTTTLYSAINRGNYHIVPEIISKFYIDEIDPVYLSICDLYCNKKSEFIQALENPTIQNSLLVLDAVINYNDIELLKYLLDLNNNSEYNQWALIFSTSNFDIMKYLVEDIGVDIFERRDEISIYCLLRGKNYCLKYLSTFGLIYDEDLSNYSTIIKNNSLKIIDYFKSKNAFIKINGINISLEWND